MKILLKPLLLAAALVPHIAGAQEYPAKLVNMVIPFSPGGSNDIVGRFTADGLGKLWKQTVLVENRPGAGTAIGAAYVAKSPADGYRVLFVSSSYTTNAATRTDLSFDPLKDLRPVAMAGRGLNGVVTGTRVPMATLADLGRAAKAGTIFYGTVGIGSNNHFLAELLSDAMGIQMTGVPYKGGTEALVDLVGGRIDVMAGAIGGLVPYVKGGKAKMVAVMGSSRSPAMPDVPTTAELGFPAAAADNYWSIFVPAGTPNAVNLKINQGVRTVTHTPEGRQLLAKLDSEPAEMSVDELPGYVAKEIAYWTKLARKLNITSSGM